MKFLKKKYKNDLSEIKKIQFNQFITSGNDCWKSMGLLFRNTIQENAFLRRLAVSRGAVNGMFLGATVAGKGKDYGWIDGSNWDYANFYSGETRSFSSFQKSCL